MLDAGFQSLASPPQKIKNEETIPALFIACAPCFCTALFTGAFQSGGRMAAFPGALSYSFRSFSGGIDFEPGRFGIATFV